MLKPLPIAIQYVSKEEVKYLHHVLYDAMSSLLDEPSSSEIVDILVQSQVVQTFCPDNTQDFYPVTIGTPPGIHETKCVPCQATANIQHLNY